MDDPKRLYQKATHTVSNDAAASPTVSIVKSDDEYLEACLNQDPVQILEHELIHDVPKDPVLEVIFRHVNAHVPHTRVAAYLKLNYIKLAAIHAMKETDQKEADLILALQTLEVDTAKYTIYVRDGLAYKAQKACRALAQSHDRLLKSSAFKLKQFIRESKVQVPKVYKQINVDDLCAVWYAINSDSHYSCSRSPGLCHPHEFRVLVITHLHLVGGTAAHHLELKKPKHTSYQQYIALLPDFLSMARCKQISRLGYSIKAPTDGPWLFQHAASLEALDIGRWTELSEDSYSVMKRESNQAIFLIHVSFDIP